MEHYDGATNLYLQKYLIIKKTPKGTWIEIRYGVKKWIGDTSRNRWAHNIEYEALKHYIRRKTYRNVCIRDEAERNELTIADAKILLKSYDRQGKKFASKRSLRLNKSW